MEDNNAHVLAHDVENLDVQTYATKAEWVRARRGVITSTDVAPLAGVGKFGTPLSVFAEKMKEDAPEDDVEDAKGRLLLGQVFQPAIATAYALTRLKADGIFRDIVNVPEHTLYIHARHKDHGASLDCWEINAAGDESHPLEVKLSAAYPDEPFDDWLAQVQWQMHVTGSRMATIAALCGGDTVKWWDIERDEEIIGQLTEIADTFIAQHLLPEVPPESDGSENSSRAMRRLYPASDGSEITMGVEELDRVVQIQDFDVRIALLEKEKGVHTDALKQKMGGASVAYLPNGGKITWKSFPKKGYFVKEQIVRPFKITAQPAEKKRN